MSEAIFWTIEATIKDGKRGELEQFLAAISEETKRVEPTTLAYEFYVGESDSSFRALERYASSEAALAHLGNAGPKLGSLMACLDGAPKIVVWGAPSDALRAAIADFHPTYCKPIGGFRR